MSRSINEIILYWTAPDGTIYDACYKLSENYTDADIETAVEFLKMANRRWRGKPLVDRGHDATRLQSS